MKKSILFFIIIILVLIGVFTIKSSIKNSDSNLNIVLEDQTTTLSNENINENKQQEDYVNNFQNEKQIEHIDNKTESKKNSKHEKQTVGKEYFDDALFIGDSRTVGISEYGDLNNAIFFANTGMSVYNVFEKNVSVPQVGKLKLEQLLTYKKFGKIYIMLGINELGYNREKTLKKYKDLLKFIQEKQSNAIIYIEANLHVTAERSNKDKTINNININKINNEISQLADNEKIFFIDVNEKFDDENGNLSSNYTQDNVHIYAKYYKEWSDWLSQNAVK